MHGGPMAGNLNFPEKKKANAQIEIPENLDKVINSDVDELLDHRVPKYGQGVISGSYIFISLGELNEDGRLIVKNSDGYIRYISEWEIMRKK